MSFGEKLNEYLQSVEQTSFAWGFVSGASCGVIATTVLVIVLSGRSANK